MTLDLTMSNDGYRWQVLAVCALTLVFALCVGPAQSDPSATLPAYRPKAMVFGRINSVGAPSMQPLMDAWIEAFQRVQPGAGRGPRWDHASLARAVPALIFEQADLAPMTREPGAAELAAYAHQFHGDMMRSPVLVRVGRLGDRSAYLALNKRPDSPVPALIGEFLNFVLSEQGQRLVSNTAGFQAIAAHAAADERLKFDGFLTVLDPDIPPYELTSPVNGEVNSVGSDGMKSLIDRWMRHFRLMQPGVRPGNRWEHVGTLNGFYALLAGETDIAPMGRELWPEERAAYAEVHHQAAPLEIRVARGGFNTPQRTTAQAIFVNDGNPISRITLLQLAGILQKAPTITHWGQLGLEGEWATRPIVVYTPRLIAPNATSMRQMVLNGSEWNVAAHQGSIDETAASIARDSGAIGFGGFEEGGPGLKTLAVAVADGGPYFEGNAVNASSGRYPLTRYMYIRLNRRSGEPLKPAIRELLRYILSREGQEPILYSGYFPLNAEEINEELAKLE